MRVSSSKELKDANGNVRNSVKLCVSSSKELKVATDLLFILIPVSFILKGIESEIVDVFTIDCEEVSSSKELKVRAGTLSLPT